MNQRQSKAFIVVSVGVVLLLALGVFAAALFYSGRGMQFT